MKTYRLSAAAALAVAATALAAGSSPAAAHAATSAQDKTWLSTSMEGDRFEMIGGQLAMTHSDNARVRQLGHRLMVDHQRALQRSAAAAHSRDVDVPHEPSPSEQWELDMLSQLRGPVFDLAYTSLEVKDHEQDISEATIESQTGSDAYVVKLARQAIGMYHRHLHLSHVAFESLT